MGIKHGAIPKWPRQIGNLKGPGGTTPLMQAVLCGDLESVRLLLDNGADPNIRNEAGATALMWAVEDLGKARLLIERGADVQTRSDDSRTPLLIAAGRFGSAKVVKLLLDRGADLSVKSPAVIGYATVLSEAARLQPYFDGGFPHGHDQWVSAAATNWAAMALAFTITPSKQ
jgi:ankyrin repeat protein